MIKEMSLCPQWERLAQGSHAPVVLGNGEGWKLIMLSSAVQGLRKQTLAK